ncbi:MAG: dephospho-CoA kinase [Candidatus Obscuribacterales bacterium]|nr:dephospho-CoA kinase [Candidatus Obscuribacterales bacterium]
MNRKTRAELSQHIGDRIGNSIFAIETNFDTLARRLERGEIDKVKELIPAIQRGMENAKERKREICRELNAPIRIGITGGIACGKSSVSQVLKSKGALVIDTDEIAHALLAGPNPTYDAVLARFGEDIATHPGGPIDRKRLGQIVFSDPQAKRDLEEITHPAIDANMLEAMAQHSPGQVVAVQIPLLFECNIDKRGYFDEIWAITVDPVTQLERLMKRNNLTQEDALRRINSQMSQFEKARRSTRVIDNSGTPMQTRKLVLKRLRSVKEKFQ